ncbi:hypothetical protein ABBQ32_001081 [Trebouxia sp. C0010 RCD-2024]
MEEEDFEGYIKQFRPGEYPYEVAYDDGDEEWGWFSTTLFHTDEVSRKYSWLTDQDEAVAKAAAKAFMHLEGPTAASANTAKPESSSSTALAAVAPSVAPSLTGTVGSIAFKKDQLRAARNVLSHKALGQAPSTSVIHPAGLTVPAGNVSAPAPWPKSVVLSANERGSTGQLAESVAPKLPKNPTLKADSSREAPAVQSAPEPAQGPTNSKAAVTEANARTQISGPAAAKLQLTASAQPPTRKRKSTQLQHGSNGSTEAPLAAVDDKMAAALPAGVATSHSGEIIAKTDGSQPDGSQPDGSQPAVTNNATDDQALRAAQQQQASKASPERTAKQKAAAEKRVKHANDPQPNAATKEHKRRRLRKVSERDASDPQMKTAGDLECVDGARPAVKAQNGKVETSTPTEDDDTIEAHQERRESNGTATTSATTVPALSQQKPVAQDRKQKHPLDTGTDVQPHRTESGAVGGVLPASGGNQASATMTASTQKLSKAGSASVTDNSTEAAQTAAAGSKPSVRLDSKQTALLPPFTLPGSASAPSASPRLPSRASSILGGASTSTRISLPPKLTQLTTLRSKAPLPELKSDESPSEVDSEVEEAAAAAAVAIAATAVEAHLKAVTQQFDALLQNTLQRTKDSVHRVTQFAVRAAAGKHGKTAAHRLVIMILDTIETAHTSKRVDLFYLLDSLLQVSLRESKDGSEAKVEASKTFSRVIAAGLHRIASAMAKDSDCITKASKVLDLWQRRQILAKSVVKPALDLLGKMKAEHEAAAASAAMAANKMGQPLIPRRPLRLVMPYAPLDSETGLPTSTICYPLDQWGSLAGFRFQGLDGQVSEFELKPNWCLPLHEVPEDWDVNPATEDLPLDQVLAAAAAVRREHLAELERQKEAKERRETSPWAERLEPHADYTAASPSSFHHGDDAEIMLDADQDTSPAEGETGYYETAPDSAFQFEPPRAPAHYGASRNSPSEDFHRAGSHNLWAESTGIGLPWAAGTLGSSWTHPSLQSQQSLYDPMSQSHGRLHPRLHELAEDQLHASGRSQSPESGSWYNVPFGDAAQPAAALAAAGTSTGVQYQHRRPASEQAVQPQVAVRDSSVDFDMDTGFSDDDDAPPPLPAEPPPGSDAPPLPSEEPLPPLPPDEDRPPLPPDDPSAPPLPEGQPAAGEPRLATAGLFEAFPYSALSQTGSTPPPLPPAGFECGFS